MAETPPDDLAETKKELRGRAKARRAETAAAASDAGERLCAHLLAEVAFPDHVAVSAYWPMDDEIDTRPAMRALHARGHAVGLPVMPGRGQPLVFRAWYPEQELSDGGFGTRIPPADAPVLEPLILLVPLLAFDRAGYRLGYGGGFYDRTLAELRARNSLTRAIGVGYAGQEIPRVPRDHYDQRLDMIVTEDGPVALGKGAGAPAGAR